MIICYKLPSYPKLTASLPFAKISAMRKKHLVKYYSNCSGVKRFRKDVRREELPTFAQEKSAGTCRRAGSTPQRETEIKKMMREVTGHFGALGRRLHSAGKRRQEFSTEKKKDCTENVDDAKEVSEVHGKTSKISDKPVRTPVYIP